VSASSSGTLTIYDSSASGTGDPKIADTFSVTAGTSSDKLSPHFTHSVTPLYPSCHPRGDNLSPANMVQRPGNPYPVRL
jgi:hypothetical protein